MAALVAGCGTSGADRKLVDAFSEATSVSLASNNMTMVDTDCLGQALVDELGGGKKVAEEYEYTALLMRNYYVGNELRLEDVELAQSLAGRMIRCDGVEAALLAIWADVPENSGVCLAEYFDDRFTRTVWSLEFVSDEIRESVWAQIETDFDASIADARKFCNLGSSS